MRLVERGEQAAVADTPFDVIERRVGNRALQL
jgi:hypothetical protein